MRGKKIYSEQTNAAFGLDRAMLLHFDQLSFTHLCAVETAADISGLLDLVETRVCDGFNTPVTVFLDLFAFHEVRSLFVYFLL